MIPSSFGLPWFFWARLRVPGSLFILPDLFVVSLPFSDAPSALTIVSLRRFSTPTLPSHHLVRSPTFSDSARPDAVNEAPAKTFRALLHRIGARPESLPLTEILLQYTFK
jgi:hypothetical protein